MRINFIGNYVTGYVGESSDELHLVREMEEIGHNVNKIPRDIWKSYCDGNNSRDWYQLENLKSDINIITKWSYFDSDRYINILREKSNAPVFYWTWDYFSWKTEYNSNDWHRVMCRTADLHLTNEGGNIEIMRNYGVKAYYFPFDVSDGLLDRNINVPKIYDVVFFGSCVGMGNRIEWLTEINKTHKLKIFGWNEKGWIDRGFDAEPPVYGINFVQKVAESKIILGFNVEDHCWGYWSNRTGKVLTLGGFLLYRYTPGMELFLRDGAEYFSSIEEANQKISYYLEHEDEREKIAEKGHEIGRDRFTSKARVKELLILIDRYLKGGLKNVY